MTGLVASIALPAVVSKVAGNAKADWAAIPPKVKLVIVGLLAAVLLYFVHQHYAHKAIAAAEKRGAEQAYANMEKQALAFKAKADALNGKIAAEIRKRNDETNARIAADADALRLSGPGKAVCRGAGLAGGSGGHVAPGGNGDAAGPQVPPDDFAAVPWGWLVDRAEQADLNRAEVLSWRDWYSRFSAQWKAYQKDAAKARTPG